MFSFTKLFQLIAFGALSVFAGALLFIAFVLVKFWQAAEPSVFLNWMSEHFFRLPTIMVPLNVIALIATLAALVASWKSGFYGRLFWGLGFIFLFACTITFPIYFAGANLEFTEQTIPLTAVAGKINTWSQWHWFRTSLVMIATVWAGLGCALPLQSEPETLPQPQISVTN
jgi:hypothetical protein